MMQMRALDPDDPEKNDEGRCRSRGVIARDGRASCEPPGSADRKTKEGTQKSGKSGKVKSRKQAIAIGLSKARKKGAKVPAKKKG
jgi:hypothetical protein